MPKMFFSVEGYEAVMGCHSRKLAPLYLDFARVRDTGELLDVGCGTGALTEALAERTRAAAIFGIDPSPAFVEHSARRFAGDPRIRIRQGNVLELPFADASFDHVLSLLVLMFVPDLDQAMSEMKRVTRRGARSPPACGTGSACA